MRLFSHGRQKGVRLLWSGQGRIAYCRVWVRDEEELLRCCKQCFSLVDVQSLSLSRWFLANCFSRRASNSCSLMIWLVVGTQWKRMIRQRFLTLFYCWYITTCACVCVAASSVSTCQLDYQYEEGAVDGYQHRSSIPAQKQPRTKSVIVCRKIATTTKAMTTRRWRPILRPKSSCRRNPNCSTHDCTSSDDEE